MGGDGGRSPQEEVRQESVEAVAAKPHQVKDSKNPDDLPPRIDAQMRPVGPPARRLENIERDLHLQRNLMSQASRDMDSVGAAQAAKKKLKH